MATQTRWLETRTPGLLFEDTAVGRLKREVWEASDAAVDEVLAAYGIPSPSELGVPGSYLQTTVRHRLVENRRRNDLVFVPLGCTENHGPHTILGFDTFMVTQMLEGVRRFTARQGRPVNLALPPLNYGAHPYHHLGMPGSVVVRDDVVRGLLMDTMLGLWNDGFRKQILINNHGQLWVLEGAIQEFQKTYQLPGIFRVIDWHRAVREFFRTADRGGPFETDFIHADEAETSVGLLLFPDMVEMEHAVDTQPEGLLPDGHFDRSVDPLGRPCRWSEGQGHMALELRRTPQGVVGRATLGRAQKAKRAVGALLRYLTLLNDEILAAFPPGTVPPAEKVTLRSADEMEPYLREPGSPGWKTVYALPRIGM